MKDLRSSYSFTSAYILTCVHRESSFIIKRYRSTFYQIMIRKQPIVSTPIPTSVPPERKILLYSVIKFTWLAFSQKVSNSKHSLLDNPVLKVCLYMYLCLAGKWRPLNFFQNEMEAQEEKYVNNVMKCYEQNRNKAVLSRFSTFSAASLRDFTDLKIWIMKLEIFHHLWII